MQKLSPLGIGPKIGMIAIPYIAIGIVLTVLYPQIFSFGPAAKKPLLIAGIVVLAVALILYAATVRSLLKGLKANKLMTTGAFRYCQNPLYAVMILLIIPAVALLLNSWIVLTTSLIAYFIFKINIHTEYEEMERIFGQEYIDYKKRTPEFFPGLLGL
jgi:protein-S-isoprenylcysteine O-methyltransferase Ste14